MNVPRRVVVIGGGFAGVAAARALGDRHQVTLVDRRSAFEFLPNVHEIISDLKTPRLVRLPLERLTRQLGQRFVQGAVVGLDLEHRTVSTERAGPLPYDALVIAAGLASSHGGVPGAAEHAIALRSADEAARIRDAVERLADLRRPASITVVGGGVSGIEVLGELLRAHRKKRRLRFRVVEAGARLARWWPSALHRRVKKLAERHDVELVFGARVAEVRPDALALADGRVLDSALTIWTGGGTLPEVLAASGLVRGRRGGLATSAALQCIGHPEVFVAGDLTDAPTLPRRQAPEALRLGRHAGRNVRRALAGRSLRAFDRKKGPVLVTFGDLTSFLVLPSRTVVETPALATGRELVFQRSMAQLDDLRRKGALGRLERRLDRSLRELDWAGPGLPFQLLSGAFDLRVYERR